MKTKQEIFEQLGYSIQDTKSFIKENIIWTEKIHTSFDGTPYITYILTYAGLDTAYKIHYNEYNNFDQLDELKEYKEKEFLNELYI